MTERLFADQSSDALAVPPESFTELEKASLDRILAFARDPANKGRELMICLNTDGTVAHDLDVGQGRVDLTDKMKRAMEANMGVRLWHNHPSQQSLSHVDWWNTSIKECLEVLAVNESGTLFVGRLNPWQEPYDKLIKQFPVIAGLVERKLDGAAKRAGFDFDQVPAVTNLSGHILNLAMRQAGVVRYAFLLSADDQATFDLADTNGIIQHALAYAVQEIRAVLAESSAS